MIWTYLDTWIVIIACLSAVSCALLGNFLVLRKMSMMGDAISHAVLPGIAIAFIVSGSRDSWMMFAGAVIAGILTALFTQGIHKLGKVDEGASMGIVFTSLFAIGLILINFAAHDVDLDPSCVLYGAIELAPLNTVEIGGIDIPRSVLSLGLVLIVNVILVSLFYKELKISSFDPALATTMGVNANLMHYALMVMVAITTVACFESAGSILVVAMFIVPAATAYLCTHRMSVMIFISLVVAVLMAVLGHVAAITIPQLWGFSDTITAGGISVVAAFIFILAVIFAPEQGVLSQRRNRFHVFLKTVEEDILGVLYRLNEAGNQGNEKNVKRFLYESLGVKRKSFNKALLNLVQNDRVQLKEGLLFLTETGETFARSIIRSHRLWEAYIYKHFNIPADHLHDAAERLEHITTKEMQDRLYKEAGETSDDPHGKPIPEK